MMKGGMAGLMKQAQQMQEKMQKMQEELANAEVTGQSGAGLVSVVMTGRHDVKRVSLDDSLMQEDKEILEDLIAAAVNDAVRKIEQNNQEKMSGFTSGMQLPPGSRCPSDSAFVPGPPSSDGARQPFPLSDESCMSFSPLIRQLIESLRILPGVGQKSAQRMALMLLERDRSGGLKLAQALTAAMEGVGHCRRCRTLSEEELCPQCADPRRDDSLLCVVEGPLDVFAVEQTGYRGRYFVLKGHLSPLDGLGPEAIGIPELEARIRDGAFSEVILATNPTVEGEATAHYIAQLLAGRGLTLSRIAHGVPLGGELELVDGGTLAHALAGRRPIS